MATRENIQQHVDDAREKWDGITVDVRERVNGMTQGVAPVDALGVSLISVGVGTIAIGLVRRRMIAGVFGGAFIAAGLACLGSSAYSRRSEHISEAEDVVRDQLSNLDPIARAQVLRDMAVEQAAAFKRHDPDAN